MKSFPEVVTSGEGCKKDDAVERYYNRTAGMFYAFRSCGIRLSHWEMYTAESLSSVFSWMVDLFSPNPDKVQIRGIVYDRACDLKPFVRRLSNEGNKIATNYLGMEYIVDIFHCEKHTEAKCILSHPSCEYHPHLERFNYVKNMNTEIAEQAFSAINPFKFMTRKMSYAKRLLFFKFMDENYNSRLLKKFIKSEKK